MAVYEFECVHCGERFEMTERMKDHDHLKEQPPACPKCGKHETRQAVTEFSCKTPSGY
jgi:putative FmdB family regulatory protein